MNISENFMKDLSAYLDSVGTKTKDDEWSVDTKAGTLLVFPRNKTIFSRFEDPERANELKVYSNPHSGKWNFHGRDAFEQFKGMLDKILMTNECVKPKRTLVSEATRYMFEEEGDMEYYVKWSSVFDDPDAEYDINLFKDTLEGVGASVWTDNQYGWSNQPEVVMFKGISPKDAQEALSELPVFSEWGAIIGEVDVDWDEPEEDTEENI